MISAKEVEKVFNSNIPVTERVKASIELARKSGVKESRIIKSTDELDKWILGK